MSLYQIIDEPTPGPLSRLSVNPMWPLLSCMLGGPVFALCWFTLNAFALNGPNRNKELVTVALAFVAFFLVYNSGVKLWDSGFFGQLNNQYFYLFGVCVQLIFCYPAVHDPVRLL